jgi:hypothetical protein
MNLGIDSAWSKNNALDLLYPVRNPHNSRALRAYQHLGLYLSHPGDLVILPWLPDPEFLSWQQQLGLSFGKAIVVQEAEYNEAWEDELREIASQHTGKYTPIFAGLSDAEVKISDFFSIQGLAKEKVDVFSKLNRKDYVFQLCKEESIPFPVSQLVDPIEWKSWSGANAGLPAFLKAPHSSGGGGLLEIKIESDPILSHVERIFLKFKIQEKWLLQKKYKKVADYSVCYELQNGEVIPKAAFEISYGRNRSSWRHKRIPPKGELDFFISAGKRIGMRLASEAFSGAFALDGFKAETGEVFPAVDLNARFDKARLIHAAAERYGMADSSYESRLLRIANSRGAYFSEWYERVSKALDHPFYPYHLGGGISPSLDPKQFELSYFLPESCRDPGKSAATIANLSLAVFGGELMDHGNDR